MNKYSQLLEDLLQDVKDEILLFKKSDVKDIKNLIQKLEAKGGGHTHERI